MNPCEECIVTSMCRNPCDKFKSYVKEKFKEKKYITISQIRTIHFWLMESKYIKEIHIKFYKLVGTTYFPYRLYLVVKDRKIDSIINILKPIHMPLDDNLLYYRTDILNHEVVIGVEPEYVLEDININILYEKYTDRWIPFGKDDII